MMRIAVYVVGITLTYLCCHAEVHAETSAWQSVSVGQGETVFVAVTVHPTIPSKILAATPHTVYASADSGQSWQAQFQLPIEATVTALATAASLPVILVATDQGLYGSFDDGQHWSKIFHGLGEGENSCTYVAFHPDRAGTALLGTHGGLLLSTDNGHQWTKLLLPPGATNVEHFTFDPQDANRIYLITPERCFVGTLSDGRWEERLRIPQGEETAPVETDATELSDDLESDQPLRRLSAIAVDPENSTHLYLATSRGLQHSMDGGTTWHWLTRSGLESTMLSRLLLQQSSPLVMYAATGHGVARYESKRERWETITSGLASRHINDLVATPHQLWAATAQGLYRYEIPPEELNDPGPLSARELLANFVHEPTIRQVQETAIRYAEVHPDKIKHWRRQAALKALLPSIDVGMDHGASHNLHVDEGTFPNFQLIHTKDRDAGMDISVKWNLSDLIWSTDQTSIDVRSKLMVQLRDDLLDEVTRAYFERRRLQILLLIEPPPDQRTSLEKALRLQELTAQLDGLTGGYFSKHLDVTKEE